MKTKTIVGLALLAGAALLYFKSTSGSDEPGTGTDAPGGSGGGNFNPDFDVHTPYDQITYLPTSQLQTGPLSSGNLNFGMHGLGL